MRLAAGLLLVVGAGIATRLAVGSDHQDTPFVELNPKTDLTDVYAFPGANTGRIVLAMDTRAFLTLRAPGAVPWAHRLRVVSVSLIVVAVAAQMAAARRPW